MDNFSDFAENGELPFNTILTMICQLPEKGVETSGNKFRFMTPLMDIG